MFYTSYLFVSKNVEILFLWTIYFLYKQSLWLVFFLCAGRGLLYPSFTPISKYILAERIVNLLSYVSRLEYSMLHLSKSYSAQIRKHIVEWSHSLHNVHSECIIAYWWK